MTDLSQECLKELLTYDPETGLFRWRVGRGPSAKAEQVAGCYDRAGYVTIMLDGKTHKAHRLAFLFMKGNLPPRNMDVDHINGAKDDNRWCNLRIATRSENATNRGPTKNNRLGVKGVYRLPSGNFRAAITVRGNRIKLGTFDTISAASAAYAEAANDAFGQFARSA